MYDEQIDYDKNGNILSPLPSEFLRVVIIFLDVHVGAHTIDDLIYDYEPNSNVLKKVTDLTNDPMGFKDNANPSTNHDYFYDGHGNADIQSH